MRKFSIGLVIGIALATVSTVYAINITVPSAPGAGYSLISTSTGAYVAAIQAGVTSTVTIGTSTKTNAFDVTSSGNKAFTITIPSNLGFFTNDSGYLTSTPSISTSGLKTFYATVCASGCDYTTTGTNDDVIISNAVNAASAAGGGTVVVRRGTYNWGSGATVFMPSSTVLMGEGFGTVFNCSTGNCLKFASSTNSRVTSIHFDGTNQTKTYLNGDQTLVVHSSRGAMIDHNWFTNIYGYALRDASNVNTSSSEAVFEHNFLQCNGLQDCIGGGPNGTGNSTTSDIIYHDNFIYQTVPTGTIENTSNDTNCIDMVAVLNVNFHDNTCYGQLVFGSEQSPNLYSRFSNNTVFPPLGAIDTSGDIVLLTSGTGFTPLPGQMLVQNNMVKYGHITVVGTATNTIQNVKISNNEVTVPSSTAQSYNGIKNTCIGVDTTNGAVIENNTCNGITSASGTAIISVNSTNTISQGNTINNFATGVNLNSGAGSKSILDSCNSVTTCVTGASFPLTFDPAGVLTALFFKSSGTSTLQGFTFTNATGTGDLRVNGNLTDPNNNKYSTSTGSGGGVGTSTLGSYTPGNLFFVFNSSTMSAANGISINSSTGQLNIGTVSSTGSFFAAAGSVGSPSYSFNGSANSGMFLSGTNVTFSDAGTSLLILAGATQAQFRGNITTAPGISWTTDTGTGINDAATNNVMDFISNQKISFSTNAFTPLFFQTTSSQKFQNTTSSMLQLSGNTIQNGNVSGTAIGANYESGYNGDFMNLQMNSSTKLIITTSSIGVATGQPSSTLQIVGNNAQTSTLRVSKPDGTTLFDVNTTTTGQANSFQVASGTQVQFAIATSGIPLFMGTSTALAIGGASLTGGTCTSTTTVVPLVLSTTTDVINTSPQVFPGADALWASYISVVAAGSSTVTTEVCEPVLGTPVSTKYNFTIQRMTYL